jgi:hypothetical protein
MSLAVFNFKQLGPAGFPLPSLNDAQYYVKTLNSAVFTLKHPIVRFQPGEDGTLQITCPGQGPITIPLLAATQYDRIFYVPKGTTVRWITTTVEIAEQEQDHPVAGPEPED